MKEPLVYIIILNWNGYKDTLECINSLLKVSYRNYRIIIVDNGSTDESVKIIKEHFPTVNIIESKKNLGFSGGCNMGIIFAMENNAEYILLLNNDTIHDPEFLKNLVNVSTTNKKIGIVSPIIYYKNNKKVIWSSGAVKVKGEKIHFVDMKNSTAFRNSEESDHYFVDCVWGCCMLIRSSAINKAGLFNEKYFLYLEDIDYCIRVKKQKYMIAFTTKAKIWHKVSGSSGGEDSNRQTYYNTRNYFILANTHLNYLEKNIFFMKYIIGKTREVSHYITHKKYQKIYYIIVGLLHGIFGKTGKYNVQG